MAGYEHAIIDVPQQSWQSRLFFWSLVAMLMAFEAFTGYSIWEDLCLP
jgi:hypothetical protein